MPVNKPTHRKHLPYHDYKERCIYHITLVCSDRAQVLGRIVGESVNNARCELTPLGAEVAMAIKNLPVMVARYGENVQVLAAVCMPEHVHFVLYVKERMKDGLWRVIRGFKQGCNKRLRYWLEKSKEVYGNGAADACEMKGGLGKSETPNGKVEGAAAESSAVAEGSAVEGSSAASGVTAEGSAVASGSSAAFGATVDNGSDALPLGVSAFLRQLACLKSARIKEQRALFEDDFDETRLRRKGQLRAMIDYVHNNPMHRWQKQHYPQWLIPMRGIQIGDMTFDCIGNVNLFGLPRWQVHVRRAWSEEERRRYQNECVVRARKGSVLVSPFISEHEAAVRDYCLKEGHSVIVVVNNGFSGYEQCPAKLYDYCVEGQVLVLACGGAAHVERRIGVSRAECVRMNDTAEMICKA